MVVLVSRKTDVFLEMTISLATRSKIWLPRISFWIPYTMSKVSLAYNKRIMDTEIGGIETNQVNQ